MLTTIFLAILVVANGFIVYNLWLQRWQPYDPSWLVALAREQHPDKPWLVESLRLCTRAQIESPYYTRFYFVTSRNETWIEVAVRLQFAAPV